MYSFWLILSEVYDTVYISLLRFILSPFRSFCDPLSLHILPSSVTLMTQSVLTRSNNLLGSLAGSLSAQTVSLCVSEVVVELIEKFKQRGGSFGSCSLPRGKCNNPLLVTSKVAANKMASADDCVRVSEEMLYILFAKRCAGFYSVLKESTGLFFS